MTFAPGQIVTSPLGRPIKLTKRDGDGKWICRYLDCEERQEVALSERVLWDGMLRLMSGKRNGRH